MVVCWVPGCVPSIPSHRRPLTWYLASSPRAMPTRGLEAKEARQGDGGQTDEMMGWNWAVHEASQVDATRNWELGRQAGAWKKEGLRIGLGLGRGGVLGEYCQWVEEAKMKGTSHIGQSARSKQARERGPPTPTVGDLSASSNMFLGRPGLKSVNKVQISFQFRGPPGEGQGQGEK